MNKQQVIDKLHKHLQSQGKAYQKWEIKEVVDVFLTVISDSLNKEKNISLSKFGKFSVKTHKGRNFHNIHTGRIEYSPDRKVVLFTHKNK